MKRFKKRLSKDKSRRLKSQKSKKEKMWYVACEKSYMLSGKVMAIRLIVA